MIQAAQDTSALIENSSTFNFFVVLIITKDLRNKLPLTKKYTKVLNLIEKTLFVRFSKMSHLQRVRFLSLLYLLGFIHVNQKKHLPAYCSGTFHFSVHMCFYLTPVVLKNLSLIGFVM